MMHLGLQILGFESLVCETGGCEAAEVALRSVDLVRAHQDVMAESGLAPTWASLLALAHRPPRPPPQATSPGAAAAAAAEQEADTLRQQVLMLTQRCRRYKDRVKQLEVRATPLFIYHDSRVFSPAYIYVVFPVMKTGLTGCFTEALK